MRVGQWLCSSVTGLSSRAFRDGDAFMVSLEQVEPSKMGMHSWSASNCSVLRSVVKRNLSYGDRSEEP